LGVILNGVDIRNPDYADYRSYYPTYYASMQEELKTNNGRPDHGWELKAAKDDEIIGEVEDLDRLMRDLGFHKQGGEQSAYRVNGAGSPSGLVPRPFLHRLASELSESLGSNAFATVASQVAAIGESMDAFPMARIWELAQLAGQQIPQREPRMKFLRKVAHEIRALPSQAS
jgi:hypothetical protein